MNIAQRVTRRIIKKSFNFSVWTIEQFHDLQPYNEKSDQLSKLPLGTLGNDISKCLEDNKLRLVPKYESHDLKHVLLGFEMTPEDEIRMQAFMLGNGNYTLPCFAILLFGAILLPELWQTLYNDFRNGQNSQPISDWTIEVYKNLETKKLRKQVINNADKNQTIFDMRKLTKYASFTSITAGIFGMLFCLPFLFSSSLEDLVGAGFPFVGGAILTMGGLISLSNLDKQKEQGAYAGH